MSVWSNISGKVRNSKNVSIKKLVAEVMHDEDYVFVTGSVIEDFEFRYCADGHDARKIFERFITKLDDLDLKYDLEVTIRWLR